MTRYKSIIAASSILLLLAPATLAQEGVSSPSAQTEIVSMAKKPIHADWDRLLSTYVATDAEGVNRVNYGAWKANAGDVAALEAYIGQFATLDFDTLSRDEQFAAWANLYNAVTVDYILGEYPTKSIRSGYIIGPWKRIKTVADGREVSLDAIEHDILRVEWDEPRVHYAINCAAYSCPNLPSKAWQAETLDAELDKAARAYVNDPRGVTVTDRGLVVSRIYDWFEKDFGGSKASVISHLKEYASPELAAQIEAAGKIRKYEYDWSLNDAK